MAIIYCYLEINNNKIRNFKWMTLLTLKQTPLGYERRGKYSFVGRLMALSDAHYGEETKQLSTKADTS